MNIKKHYEIPLHLKKKQTKNCQKTNGSTKFTKMLNYSFSNLLLTHWHIFWSFMYCYLNASHADHNFKYFRPTGNEWIPHIQLFIILWLEEWWAWCSWFREWDRDGDMFLCCGRRCDGKPRKCSLKVAHSPKVIFRSSLRSSSSPKTSAEPLRP